MSHYLKHAIHTLKQQGFRITQPRMHILQLLDESQAALSVPEIKTRLDEQQLTVDMVSVYRVIDCLEANHLVHRLLSDGKVRKCNIDESCQKHPLHHAEECHHLIRCQDCDQVREVHCEGLESLIEQFQQQSGYQVRNHYLELTGICEQCQALHV